ncbi:hypothetical protein N7495_000212 [Penicillium taxi]|uniref:uncharacterized protein n=1 Tax=Penicillium taxi TaxID=168475 RepID=UPI0025454A8C|nr:uncharacterized protein N7495_000212 [Penicillium taxi]KAJ5907530.1 hypothetical protein N7495_000212 [Penicillium taxi]
MNQTWDSTNLQSASLHRRVTQIHLCCLRDGTNPANHWVIHLELAGGSTSVKLDMTARYPPDLQIGRVELATRNFPVTTNAIQTWEFPVLTNVTVQGIIDMLRSHGFEKYKFTPEIEGCRWWMYTLMSALESKGHLRTGTKGEVWTYISRVWHDAQSYEPRRVQQGVFYQ